MTFIGLFVKSLSGTAPPNHQQRLVEMQLFAFKHMLECTCTDSARGYSSFSLPKHYVPVRYSVLSYHSSKWVQTLPPICISAATKVVLAPRLQSLLLLSPGWIQSSAGVNTALRFWKEIQIHPRTVRKRVIFSGIADRNVHQIVFFYITSGKTEYQTTKASKARRSASFERRPSRRYSRRTMQNRGKNTNDTSPYTLSASIIITHLYTWWLESDCLLCFLCVRRTTEFPWVSICVLCVQALSVHTSVNQMPWLTPFLLNSFSSLECNPVTEVAFCYRICWRANDIMSLLFF